MPSRVRVHRTEAIVLRRTDFGEADRLLVLFTPELGKVRAIAKGVRKLASRKAGHIELYSRTDFLLSHGREMEVVTQAQVLDPHRAIHDDLMRASYAAYLAELLDRFVEEQDVQAENTALYGVLVHALAVLCAAPDHTQLALLARHYELHVLSLTGYLPELNVCVACRKPLQPVPQYFGLIEGGVLCPTCGELSPRALDLSLDALKLLRHLQRNPWEAVETLRPPPAAAREVERLLGRYLAHMLERRLKSVEFLNLVRAME